MCTNGQRHELGEAARLLLQLAHAQQMARPMLVAVDVAEHDGRGAAQSQRRAPCASPRATARCRSCRGRGRRAPRRRGFPRPCRAAFPGPPPSAAAGIPRPAGRASRRPDTPPAARRRGRACRAQRAFTAPTDVEIGRARYSRDGCRPACRLRWRRAPSASRTRRRDLRRAGGRRACRAGSRCVLPFEKAQNWQLKVADVGVVDVAGDDVGDGVAVDASRAARRRPRTRRETRAPRARKSRTISASASALPRCAFARTVRELLRDDGDAPRQSGAASRSGSAASATRATSRRCAASRRHRLCRSTRRAQCRIEPSVRRVGHRPDRSRAARPVPCRPLRSRARSTSRCGHGASGLTWSGVTGDTPPQSLMPAAIKRRRAPGLRLGGAWMFIAGSNSSRAIAIVQRCSSSGGAGRPAMRVPGFGRKFWMMISWMWPCASLRSRSASSASMRSCARLADADQDAGGEGHALLRRRARIVSSRAAGRLSGEP